MVPLALLEGKRHLDLDAHGHRFSLA
jgi:hypothetical protein